MKLITPLLILFLTYSVTISAQNTTTNTVSIENQFDNIFRKSSNYQQYKVINRQQFLQLKAIVNDSLLELKKETLAVNNLLNTSKTNITRLSSEISNLKSIIENTKKEKNTVSFLGIELSKTMANLLLWLLILGLLGGLIFFAFKFKKSNILTSEAQHNLLFSEQEFEQHRKRAIEREQKIRRELLDEINKHKK